MSETVLHQHMAVVGRVIANVSTGLLTHNIDSRRAENFLGAPEDKRTFESVIGWMLDEGIIRAKNVSTTTDGTIYVAAAQLTAKGLAIVKQPVLDGETIEKRIQSGGDDNSFFGKIGELVGSAAGSFAKSLSSG